MRPVLTTLDRRPASAASPSTPGRGSWGPKPRRWFQRILSGVTHHLANRRRVRVITLTTAPAAASRDLNADFLALRKRIDRKFGKVEYWKLRTSEGNGVLHILYVGPYIPQSWLSRSWEDIHFSHRVWIQLLRFRGKRLVNYLMSHYLPSHDDYSLYTRMSWSWGWVFRGFAGAWKWFWRRGPTMYEAIIEWNKLMRREEPLISYKRMRGKLYVSKPLTFYI